MLSKTDKYNMLSCSLFLIGSIMMYYSNILTFMDCNIQICPYINKVNSLMGMIGVGLSFSGLYIAITIIGSEITCVTK
jgi:hypothetical protein